MLRRDFLQLGAFPLLGNVAMMKRDVNCILLMLTGGPSHLDTWDMKPDAPREIRGPFRPIRTNVRGIEISEIFPRMAKHADKYALIRSVCHDAPPLHPDFDSLPLRPGGPKPVFLPCGAEASAFLRPDLQASPDVQTSPDLQKRYGLNPFGKNCLRARQLVESGTRFVTVSMFHTVFDEITWDIHGWKPFSPISCYRDSVGPMFDMAYSSLLEDLNDRGLLSKTLVVAMGEFGRTPRINPAGGRDHWPRCWTIHMAGGGVQGGQVYGSSDRIGAEPRDNPVSPAMVAATIYYALGIPLDLELPGPDGRSIHLLEPGTRPIYQVFS
jgi:hypothetical protein